MNLRRYKGYVINPVVWRRTTGTWDMTLYIETPHPSRRRDRAFTCPVPFATMQEALQYGFIQGQQCIDAGRV